MSAKDKEEVKKEIKKPVAKKQVKKKQTGVFIKPLITDKQAYKVGDACYEQNKKALKFLINNKIIKQ